MAAVRCRQFVTSNKSYTIWLGMNPNDNAESAPCALLFIHVCLFLINANLHTRRENMQTKLLLLLFTLFQFGKQIANIFFP